jgi:predicted murein hydrolase (TIGR00659 family)
MTFVSHPIFLIFLTFFFFLLAKILQNKTGFFLLNPILLTIFALIAFLQCFDIEYSTYEKAGDFIAFWLQPAVVALGVPLYLQLEKIKEQWLPILLSQLVGCVVGIVSVVLLAQLFGASREVVLSLAPKSVTTPIAMEISSVIGGIPSLTVAMVVCTGLFGALAGIQIVRISRIKSEEARGLSIGTASHAVGASAAMEVSPIVGAYSSLGLTLNGILTAILTPIIVPMLV